MERAKIVNFIQSEPYYSADIKCLKNPALQSKRRDVQALARQTIEHFEKYAKLSGKISSDATLSITNIDDLTRLPDLIASNLDISIEIKQEILEELSPKRRQKTFGYFGERK